MDDAKAYLILKSSDGQNYARIIGYFVEQYKTAAEASAKAASVMSAVRTGPASDEYTWEEDLLPALSAAGFFEPNWQHGPTWDAEL